MAGLNKVMLIGNVGKDPEMRYTANGSAVTTFSLACNRVYNSPEGETKSNADLIRKSEVLDPNSRIDVKQKTRGDQRDFGR